MAQVAQDNLLQLATCTAADGDYRQARDLFRLFVDTLLQSCVVDDPRLATSTTATSTTHRSIEHANAESQQQQAVLLLSSHPERRKQYVFALRALVTIYTKLGNVPAVEGVNGALLQIS